MLKYILDTNIIIYTIKNKPPAIKKTFNQHTDQMCISSVTYGELIYGAEKSTKPEKSLLAIEGISQRLEVLPFDELAAIHFGQIRAELALQGKTIGPFDLMIAGHARALGLILVTNNTNEFERVPGLRIENWVK